jgi:hypothetical protein
MTDQVIDQTDQDLVPDNQKPSQGWRAALPDEFKEHDGVKDYAKVGDFVKDHLQIKADAEQFKTDHDTLKTKLETAIFKPGEDATPEEISAYRKVMGVPDAPEGYEIPKSEDVEHDEKMLSWFRAEAHKAGLSQEQVAAFVPAWDSFVTGLGKELAEGAEDSAKKAEESLKAEWGADYDKNVEFTRRGFEHFVGEDDEMKGYLNETGRGNDPVLIKFIHKVGLAMGEDWSPSGKSDGSQETVPGQEMNYNMKDYSKE